MPYPVSIVVEPKIANRNRLTTAFRLFLAIPHLILVGGAVPIHLVYTDDVRQSVGSDHGFLGAAAGLLAIVSWFTIVFSGNHIPAVRQFTKFYLRWHVRAVAYTMLLEDAYPPFGDAPYPASVAIDDPAGPRNRLTVGLRLILAIPHFIALAFILTAWWITSIIAWLVILITGAYPARLYRFGVGAMRWFVRVEAYLLLLVDEYPPFSLD